MKKHTKELYSSIIDIFNDENLTENAIYENIFEDDYVKTIVLLIAYFKLADIPNQILELCINAEDIPEKFYNIFYEHCQNEWMKIANKEIGLAIKEIEHIKD